MHEKPASVNEKKNKILKAADTNYNGNCFTNNVVYQATVKTDIEPDKTVSKYIF